MKRIEKPSLMRSKNDIASQEVLDQERVMQERMRNLLDGLNGGNKSESVTETSSRVEVSASMTAVKEGVHMSVQQHPPVARPAPRQVRHASPPPLSDPSIISTARSSSTSQSSSASRQPSPTAVFVTQRGEHVTFRPITATSSSSSTSLQRTSTSSGASRSSPTAPVVSATTTAARNAIAELFAPSSVASNRTHNTPSPPPPPASKREGGSGRSEQPAPIDTPSAPRIREPQRNSQARTPPLREKLHSVAPAPAAQPTLTVSRTRSPAAASVTLRPPPVNPPVREATGTGAAASNDADDDKLSREVDVAGRLLETFERKDEDLRRLSSKLHRVEVRNESLRNELAETHESKRGLLREYRHLLRRMEKYNAKRANRKKSTHGRTHRSVTPTSSQDDETHEERSIGMDKWRGNESRWQRTSGKGDGVGGLIGRAPIKRTSRRLLTKKLKKKRRSQDSDSKLLRDEDDESTLRDTKHTEEKQLKADVAPLTAVKDGNSSALLDASAVQRGAAVERLTLELRYLHDELKARDGCVALQVNAMLEQQQQIDRLQADLRAAHDTITAREKDVLAAQSKLEHEERVLADWKAWEREHSGEEAKARALEADRTARMAEHLHVLETEVRDARARETALLRQLESKRESPPPAQLPVSVVSEVTQPQQTALQPSNAITAQQEPQPQQQSQLQLHDARASLEKRRRKHAEAELRSATDRVRELTLTVDQLASQLEEKKTAWRAAVESASREKDDMEDRIRSVDTEWSAKYRATKDLAQKWIDAYEILKRESEQHTQRCQVELESLRAEWISQREADQQAAEKRYTQEQSEHKSYAEKLSERLRREEDRVATWRRRCAEQTAVLEDERERQLSLSSEAATFQSHCDDLERHVAQHAKEVRQLREELQQQQDRAREEKQNWEEELQASRDEQVEQQRMASNAAQLHNKQIDSLRMQLAAAHDRIREAEKAQERNNAEKERIAHNTRSAANDVKRAEEEVQRHLQCVASLESEVRELRSRCSQLKTENLALDAAVAAAKGDSVQSEAAVKKLTDINRELNRSLADQKSITSDYRSLKQTTLPALRAEVDEWQRKHTQVTAHLESKSTSVRHLQAELRSRDAKITALESEKQTLMSQVAELTRQATVRVARRIVSGNNENASNSQQPPSSSAPTSAVDSAALSERYERNFDKLLTAYDDEVQRAILHAFDDGLAVYERAAQRFVARLSSDLAELICQMASDSEKHADSDSSATEPRSLQHQRTPHPSPPGMQSESGLNQSVCGEANGRDDCVFNNVVLDAECQAIAASLGFSCLEELSRATNATSSHSPINTSPAQRNMRGSRGDAEGLLSIAQSGHFQSFLSTALLAQLNEELSVETQRIEQRTQRSETRERRNNSNGSGGGRSQSNVLNAKKSHGRHEVRSGIKPTPHVDGSTQTTDMLRHMFKALRA